MKRIIAKLSIIMLIITAVFGAGSRVSAAGKKTGESKAVTLSQEKNQELLEDALEVVDSAIERMEHAKDIENVIDRMLVNRLRYITGETDALPSGEFFAESGNGKHLDYFLEKTEYDKRMKEVSGIDFSEMRIEHIYKSMSETDGVAEVVVTENFYFVDRWYPNIPQAEGTEYSVTLCRENGKWVVADLTTDSVFDKIYRNSEVDLMDLVPEKQYEDDRTVCYDSLAVQDDEGDSVNSATIYTISTSRFTDYASSYALTPNYKFNYLGDIDCQNFASQCVWYALGGTNTTSAISSHAEPMASAGSNARNWYYDGSGGHDALWHWTSVQNFGSMISGSNASYYGLYGTITSGFANAKVGDVIQVDFINSEHPTLDGHYDHSLVVVGITGTSGSLTASQIRVSGHSSCVSNVPLTYYYSSSANYRTIHIVQCRGMDSPLYLDSLGCGETDMMK